jgi:DNA-binding transcriptional LysR family regulator
MHPMHRLAKARRVGLENLVNEPTVALSIADYPEYHAWIKRMFIPFGNLPQIVEEHDSFTGLVAAVESGKGVAIIAQPPLGLATTRLKFRRLDPAPPLLAVGITYRTKLRSKATDDFISAAKKAKAV